VIRLSNPATGHEIKVDDESAEFWRAAGYHKAEQKPAKKATAKRASARKTSK
jgi:hypothetical protein